MTHLPKNKYFFDTLDQSIYSNIPNTQPVEKLTKQGTTDV